MPSEAKPARRPAGQAWLTAKELVDHLFHRSATPPDPTRAAELVQMLPPRQGLLAVAMIGGWLEALGMKQFQHALESAAYAEDERALGPATQDDAAVGRKIAERLLSAALGELGHGGDPVPDLLRAPGELLPDDRAAFEQLELAYAFRTKGA